MKIPEQITLMGLDIKTVPVDNLVKDHGIIGRTSYESQKIFLDLNAATKQTTEQAYLHEVVHWVLYVMNREDLKDDEAFVDLLAHLLYQAKTSAIFKEIPDKDPED